jgi:hypothetical protein
MVVPTYFEPTVGRSRIQSILERTFAAQVVFCRPEATLVVVDSGSVVEGVFREAPRDSVLWGLPLLVLERNRGKTGAIRAGLRRLLEQSEAPFMVTRDCDGDNMIEDLPRLSSMARQLAQICPDVPVSVFGARPSLEKPMSWFREQWERVTNRVIVEMVQLLLARKERVLDQRFWNGYPLDLQSGYRLYNRSGAALAVQSLSELPEDREVYLLACEVLPFLDLSLQAGIVGQIQRGTLVEQPVSSYNSIDFGRYYGRLLAFVGERYQIPRPIIRQLFDNSLVSSSAFFSPMREELLRCRMVIDPDAPPVVLPEFL